MEALTQGHTATWELTAFGTGALEWKVFGKPWSLSPSSHLQWEPPPPHLLLHTCLGSRPLGASHEGFIRLAVRDLQGGTVQQDILLF